jgi:subtilisin-like proprotein convertase family protein
MFNRRFTSKRLVRVGGLLFVLVAAAIWIAGGLPGVSQRLVHAFAARPSQVKGQPGAQTKEELTARMIELDETITALKGQLVSNPKNQSLLAQLNAAITEYDQISASMGGDRAPKLGTTPPSPPPGPKEAKLDQMQALQNTIASLKLQIAGDPNNQGLKDQLDAAVSELNALSASMGGDLPSKTSERPMGSSPPAPPGCTATLTSFTNNTPVAIPTGPAVVTSTINVAGSGPYLHDLNITTFITHTFNADLDITIQSPAGTIVTLTTDNGAGNDNVFNGTVWDDDANPAGQVPYVTNNGLVTDHAYVNNVVASPLVPEEPLAAFRGENPNGTWTITISDDLAGDGGSLNSWTLDVVTIPAAPTEVTTSVSNNTPVAIPTGPAVVTSTVNVAGAGSSITNVTMMTAITHTFNADLDITIQSPSGTVVTLTTDNGAGNDNVFNGTVWDDDANPGGQVPYTTNNGMVTDHAYVNNVTATPLTPEESFGAFIGENPNGTWTITISDDLAGDGGSLNSWTLNVTTGSCAGGPCSCTNPQTFSNNTPVPIPTGPAVVTSTINVAGLGTYLYNLKATTFITHTFAADLDITIQSPAGTVVTLTTDNGAGNDNVFNGTVWDDKANPGGQVPYVTNNGLVTDHAYVNNVVATPLVPEEPFAAFIGENPNGTWTITISDDLAGDGGSLNSWSLDVCSLQSPPTTATSSFNNNTAVPIPTGPAVVTSTINAAVAGTQIGNVRLTTNITHTFNADLDITIQSPTGTVVTLTTDNGAGNDNVFAGTLWDDDANPGGQVPYTTNNGMVTDHAYVNNVLASPLTPEESLGAFIGESPTGVWTLTISDDLAGDGGSLNSWSLEITTTTCGGGQGCSSITCPANVTQPNDPNQCGAVVTYPAPTPNGSCGTITCSPASGSFFPVGTTTVTCTSSAGPTCTFTVTVQDTQPPNITCPPNQVRNNDPNQCGAVVNYPPPTITDNCPGTFTATCTPASGSFFPVGTTTVSCSVNGFGGGASPGISSPTACSTITESSSQAITSLNSVSCNNGVGHTDNSYYRAFTLSSFGIGTAWNVMSVDIGVEDAFAGGAVPSGAAPNISSNKVGSTKVGVPNATQPITVNLYTSSMPFPTGFPGSLTLIGTTSTTVADQSSTIINVPVTGTAPAGSQLVVEVFTPDGEAAGNLFFIGSNASPETGPSYLRAPACGVTNPTTTAALGFPNMHIVMNVNGCTPAAGGPTCTFTVTVNDTQPPVITCPANIFVATAVTCPPAGSRTVTYTVTASDNCPGVTVVCTPPSGSIFPVGTTTVNCTATDAHGNTASCSFTVTVFTACLVDESISGNVVLFNAQTGEYRFCCNGQLLATGTGVLTIRGCIGTIDDLKGNRKVHIEFDLSANNGGGKGTASLFLGGSTNPICRITDQNMSNNSCTCPTGGPPAAGTKK